MPRRHCCAGCHRRCRTSTAPAPSRSQVLLIAPRPVSLLAEMRYVRRCHATGSAEVACRSNVALLAGTVRCILFRIARVSAARDKSRRGVRSVMDRDSGSSPCAGKREWRKCSDGQGDPVRYRCGYRRRSRLARIVWRRRFAVRHPARRVCGRGWHTEAAQAV